MTPYPTFLSWLSHFMDIHPITAILAFLALSFSLADFITGLASALRTFAWARGCAHCVNCPARPREEDESEDQS